MKEPKKSNSQLLDEIDTLQTRMAMLERELSECKGIAEWKQRELTEALHDTSTELNSALNLEEVFERILLNIEKIAPYDTVSLMLLESDLARIVGGKGHTERGLSSMVGRCFSLVGMPPLHQVAETGKPLVISNTRVHPSWADLPETRWICSYTGVPFHSEGKIVGVINLSSATPNFFTMEHAYRLQAFADQAAIAIENARLYEQVQQEMAGRKRAEAKLSAYGEHLELLVQERTAKFEQAMAEISEAHHRIDAILQSVADGLIVTDLDHKVILANPAAERLLEIRLEEMWGQEIGTGIKDNRLRQMVQEALKQPVGDCEIDVELEEPHEGQQKVIRVRTTLVNDRRMQPVRTVSVLQNVTPLWEADRLRDELLTTIVHELRTPLTTILGFSELLLTRQLDEARQQRYLSLINEQSTHLNEIIYQLVDLSRLRAGHSLKLNFEWMKIDTLFQRSLPLLADLTPQLDIQIEGLDKLPSLKGDAFRLTQVIKNLISNAINYSPKASPITVRGQLIPGFIKICVADKGIGMTPEQKAHLFEKFYRANASNTAISGAGLGLAISKLIIEAHGGEIWVESQYGVGTKVYFTLPLANNMIGEMGD